MDQSNRSKAMRGGQFALLALSALWLGLSTTSCASVEETSGAEGEELVTDGETMCHATPTWPGGNIPVCWTSASAKADLAALEVRAAIEESWGRAADIRITGWDDICASGGVGSNPYKVVLSFNNIPNIPGYASTGYTSTSSVALSKAHPNIAWAARYLFGHVLGFEDENRHPNATTTCGASPTTCTIPGDVYDSASVMVRCTTTFGDLSTGDVLGVQKLYGRKPARSLVGLGGRCLSVQGGSTTLNTGLINSDCGASNANDKWEYSSSSATSGTQLLRAFGNTVPGASDRCAAIWGGNPSTSGTNLVTWTCPPTAANQAFRFEGVKWVVDGNRCVQAYNGNLKVASCDQFNTDWNFLPNHTIQIASASLPNTCVQVGALFNNAAPVTMQNCLAPGSANFDSQQFRFDGGLIRSVDLVDNYGSLYGDFILQAQSGYPSSTGSIIRFQQKPTGYPIPRQLFHLSGPIHTVNNAGSFDTPFCMDVAYDNFTNGNHVVSYSCTGARNQKWQYYW
ncbi:MAG: hypothetical protein EOO70_03035 [Myxococcaceae bacterium]|nr:MAG: hypothetical protein EOO70_03035 [Myxococcaceae bacterium]